MQYQEIHLEAPYEKLKLCGTGLSPRLTAYLLDNYPDIDSGRRRPAVLICPGGAYRFCSPREAEPVAMQLAARGFQTFVLNYSVAPAPFPAALLECCAAMALIRQNAREWHVDPRGLFVLGFSAGGHLAGSLGAFWQEEAFARALGVKSERLRPDGMVLCYPVISSGAFRHDESFHNLLGPRFGELREKVSLEKQVGAGTPPAFLWHTFGDGDVPVENSLLLAGALRQAGVPFELHIFPDGEHGLALATEETRNADGTGIRPECAAWIGLAADWMKREHAKREETR